MYSKKRYISVLCTLLVVLFVFTVVLSGCGSKQSEQHVSTEKTSTGEKQDGDKSKELNLTDPKGTVTFWYWAKSWSQVFDEFKKTHPNVTLNYVPVAAKDYYTKFTAAVTAGTEVPDIGAMEMSIRGKMLNMDVWDNLEDAPYNLNRSDLLDFLVPLSCDKNGHIAGVEVGPSPSGLAYRRDLAKEYLGVDKPEELEQLITDWDKFISMGAEVKKKSGGKVFMLASVNDARSIICGQNPKALIDGNKIKLNEVYLDSFKLIQKMRDEGILDTMESNSPAWNASYAEGKHIFYLCAPWSPIYTIKPNDKDKGEGRWGIMTPPEGAYNQGGTLFGIPKAAKNKEGAWAFINWTLLTKEGATARRDIWLSLTPYKKIYEDKGFYDMPDSFFGGQPILKKFAEFMPAVKVRPMSKYDVILNDALSLGDNALTTGLSAEEAIKQIVDEVKRKAPELSE